MSHAFADRDATSDGVYRDVLLGKVSVNEGMIAENAVAQALRANGHRLFFLSLYDDVAKRTLEVDFLITEGYPDAAMEARVSPIEVKSGATYTTSSLDKLRPRFQKRIGTEYVLHPKQLKVKGDRVFLPLYMAFCL